MGRKRTKHVIDCYDFERIPVKQSDRAKMSGVYPYYGATGVIDYVNDYLFDGEYLLIAEDGKNLVNRAKPLAFIAKGQFWVNNHAHVIKAKPELRMIFLRDYFER